MTPFWNTANVYAETYNRIRELRSTGMEISKIMVAHLRSWALKQVREELEHLELRQKRTIGAILSYWDTWLDHGTQTLTFRITRVLTGQGCFDEFLYKMGAAARRAGQT